MGTTLKSRAPVLMDLIACFDALPSDSLAEVIANAFGISGDFRTLSDKEFVEQIQRYVQFRRPSLPRSVPEKGK